MPSKTGEIQRYGYSYPLLLFLIKQNCNIYGGFANPAHMLRSSMEVGVCAEAYQGGEPLRHINSAFMTFEVFDSDRKPRTLPRIRPEPVVSFLSCFYL